MAGNDLGGLLGGLLGGSGGQNGPGNILGALIGALGGAGSGGSGSSAGGGGSPLDGLMGMLAKSGLVEQAQSWIATGDNQPVSGAQIAEALPDETLQQVAQEAGVSTEQAADELARALPQAVDRLTPGGELPQAESLEALIRQQQL